MGRSTRKTLPLPGSLSTVILPPCSSTILATMARPSPTPSGLVVKNGLKMVSQLLGVDAGAAVDHRDLRRAARGRGLHRDGAARRRWPAPRSAPGCRRRAPSVRHRRGRAESRARSSCRWRCPAPSRSTRATARSSVCARSARLQAQLQRAGELQKARDQRIGAVHLGGDEAGHFARHFVFRADGCGSASPPTP